MAWTTPKTWTNEPLVASDLNTHLRDNLESLKNLPSYSYKSASNYSTTSLVAVLVDSSNMNESITLESVSNVLVGFNSTVSNSGSSDIHFLIQSNSINVMQGTVTGGGSGVHRQIVLEILLKDLPAGSYTFSVLWWVGANTAAIHAYKNHFYVQGL